MSVANTTIHVAFTKAKFPLMRRFHTSREYTFTSSCSEKIVARRSNFRCAAVGPIVEPASQPQSAMRFGYAKFRSRSQDAVIRVYDNAGTVIETHEPAGDFKEP